ncbi:DUF4153 domain-containing protein [Phenylobacterium parvum]|uniref:DUF4153 domain-containing protein n=1 Tax=Phenylobacterium parvum TaxID=2201350 RepID=A0A2Z3I3Q6_9CAUL|nr:DUF4153 domain-containing protein [Phenylobacterium parvum]AWM78318.1 hypothetical protein HYN04_11495 [Phenylobacterium parvum]
MARTSRPHATELRDLLVRAAIGLTGGIAAWAVARWTPAGEDLKVLRGVLALASATLPVVLLGAYGALRWRTLSLWVLAAGGVVLLGGLGRTAWEEGAGRIVPPVPEGSVLFLTCLILAMGHVLVRAREGAGRGNPWPRHFTIAWTDGFRVALSAALAGALVGLLGLAGGLFEVIGLKQVGQFLFRPIVLWPATWLAFALGVHFTATRADLAEGARALGLGLLAWLLPLMTLLILAFLGSLPFTGLEPLWGTQFAAAVLMAACVGLIILSNAAVQDATNIAKIPRVLRMAARLAGLLMVPLIVIAAVGVFLRIGQHGLTPDRVRALACIVTLAVFAGGHALAALSRRSWLEAFGKANLTGVLAALVASLFTLSPVGDPDRLSVLDQVRRLNTGKVTVDRFDYGQLRFDTGEPGRAALRELASRPGDSPRDAEIRRRASEALATKSRNDLRLAPPVVTPIGGAPIPADFLTSPATVNCTPGADCMALSLDITGDGSAEVLLKSGITVLAWIREDSGWRLLGELSAPCLVDDRRFRAGEVRVTPPQIPVQDVEVGGMRLRFVPEIAGCPPSGGGG